MFHCKDIKNIKNIKKQSSFENLCDLCVFMVKKEISCHFAVWVLFSIWILSFGISAEAYVKEPWRWTHFGNSDFRVVNSISIGTRYIYMGGEGGLIRFDKLKGGWIIPKTREAFPSNINLVVQDFGGNEVWFTTSKVLGKYNSIFESYKINDFPDGYNSPCSLGILQEYVYLWNSRQCIRFDKFKNAWETLDCLPSKVEWFPKVSPSQYPWLAPYYVTDKFLSKYKMLCAEKDGHWLWVGTRGQGAYKYNALNYTPERYALGFSGKGQVAMLRDGKHIWIGTGQEIVRWDLNQGSSSYYLMTGYNSIIGFDMPELLPSDVVSIVSAKKQIWFGNAYGLFQFDKQSEKYERFSSERITALALEDNKLWIGTRDGLFRMENGMKLEVFENIWVNDIKVNIDEILVGTSRGLMRKVGEKWESFNDPDEILSHGVYRIFIDKQDKDTSSIIYFGSTRQGLLVYTDGKWDRFTYPVYLPGERILSIVANSKKVYIGTDKGVSVWDKKRDSWEKYTEDNSPIKGEVHSIFLDKEDVYFGTDKGVIKLEK